jgi:hypothetical protein
MLKHLALASALVLGAVASTPASARFDLRINVAPPAPQAEVVPAPRHGYVWAPGYWSWEHGHHIWVRGHWIRERRGYAWVADRWDPDGDRYVYVPGHWERH